MTRKELVLREGRLRKRLVDLRDREHNQRVLGFFDLLSDTTLQRERAEVAWLRCQREIKRSQPKTTKPSRPVGRGHTYLEGSEDVA